MEDTIIESGEAFQNQKLRLLSDPKKAAAFAKLVFDLIKMAGQCTRHVPRGGRAAQG